MYQTLAEKQFSLKKLIVLPFFLLLLVGIIMPSDGSHGMLAPKSLAFIATTGAALLHLFAFKTLRHKQVKALLFAFSFLSFLLIWFFININYDVTPVASSVDQFKLFWLTVSVVIISFYYYSERIFSYAEFIKVVIYANCFYSTAKFGLISLHLLNIINLWKVLEKIGVRFVSMGILGGLERFQMSVDTLTPFLLFFFLQAPYFGIKWSKKFRYLYFVMTPIAIFLSFSRFLMGVALVAILLHAFASQLKTIMKTIMFVALTGILFVTAFGWEKTYKIVEKRLFSKENHISDLIRQQQIDVLLAEHEDYPLMGKGLGGYAKSMIRDDQIRHSYEVQWVAMFMQFGLLGLLIILGAVSLICCSILAIPPSRQQIALFLFFCLWLISGFTNPFLISLPSGILYSIFLITGMEIKSSYQKES